jgi:uncharacterized alpha-E superfamily protein
MLGRTASGIFWMYRYLERAENTARLLAAGQRMALTRDTDAAREEWRSVLTTLGLLAPYEAANEGFASAQVCDFVLRAKTNPESVLAMLERARSNARTCRSSLTAEVWEAVNEGWMTLRDLLARPVREATLGTVLSEIRRASTLARGATHGTMLRNEIYAFARLGTFIERADKTARILDVKYYLLLPSVAHVGTALDAGQWESVLRSLSADRAYRWLNSGRMNARSIADFLILDARFPRSLRFCYAALEENLAALARLHGGENRAHELMRKAAARLDGRDIDDIFFDGLHQFLVSFLADTRGLSEAIGEEYRFNA